MRSKLKYVLFFTLSLLVIAGSIALLNATTDNPRFRQDNNVANGQVFIYENRKWINTNDLTALDSLNVRIIVCDSASFQKIISDVDFTDHILNNIKKMIGDTIDFERVETDTLYNTNFTTSKLIGTDGNKYLVSVDVSSFLDGTSNYLTVTDNGDGTATLATVNNKDVVAGTSLSGGGNNVLPGADADITISVTADGIGDTQLEYNTGQHLTTTSDVQFNSLNITNSSAFGGKQTVNITTVNSATYDLLVNDYILNVTYTTTDTLTSLTLPTAQCVSGRRICIKDAGGNAGTNSITVDTEGAETIDGDNTYILDINYEYIWLYSDGLNWFIN